MIPTDSYNQVHGRCSTTVFFFLLLFFPAAFNSTAAAQDEPDLFSPVDEQRVALDARQSWLLDAVKERPYAAEVHLVRITNASGLLDRPSVGLNVAAGQRFTFTLTQIKQRGPESFTWIGQIPDQGGHVLLVVDGLDVTGRIQTKEAVYTVDPLGAGLHALVRMDPSKLPPDENDVLKKNDQHDAQDDRRQPEQGAAKTAGAANMTLQGISVIDVLVVYTSAAASASGNINSVVQGAVDAANDALSNSGVSATLVLAHKQQISYTETGSHFTAINRLEHPSDGHMDNVHNLRDQYGADVVVLISHENDPSYGGFAAGIEVSASYAFATVEWDLAIGYYTFAHEVGHLVGGRHHNDSNNSPRPYAHGYVYSPGNWRTVMATSVGNTAFRIPYWSDPGQSYGGAAMGTANWNDNVRVWEERAATVAGFKTGSAPLAVSISGPSSVPYYTQGNWTANASGGSGSYSYKWYRRYIPSSWTLVGTNQNYSQSVSQAFYLKVVVTSGGDQVEDLRYVVPYVPPMAFAEEQAPAADLAAEEAVPESFGLAQNYPNPFNPTTEIRFDLPEAVHVRLVVYDMLGREVARLVDREMDAGYQQVTWEVGHLPSGVYLYRIEAGDFSQSRSMILQK